MINTYSAQHISEYLLSKDNELEYFCNRCRILEQEINQLREENRQRREELDSIKDTVSAFVAKNINAKPEWHNNVAKDSKPRHDHPRKGRNRPTPIDSIVTVDQKQYHRCGSKLSEPTATYTRLVEDIVPARIIVTILHYKKILQKLPGGGLWYHT